MPKYDMEYGLNIWPPLHEMTHPTALGDHNREIMMSKTRETISVRLATARKRHGWTIEETAKRGGFTRSRYSNWELGIRSPKYDELETIANVLGESPAYLVGWDQRPTDSAYHPVSLTSVLINGQNARIDNAVNIEAYRESYLEENGLTPRCLITVSIDDDVMADIVKRGDIVLIDTTRRQSNVRDMFAILVNARVWVRWIRPELDGNYTLSAEDKAQYPDETLSPQQLDNLAIIGRVARIERAR